MVHVPITPKILLRVKYTNLLLSFDFIKIFDRSFKLILAIRSLSPIFRLEPYYIAYNLHYNN